MYCTYKDRVELEDDLYQGDEGDSDGSEATSELEFRLYSQLHYSSNAGDMEEQEDRGEEAESHASQLLELTEKTVDGEQQQTGESRPPSPNVSELLQHLRKKKRKKEEERERRDKQKKGKSNSKGQRSSSSLFEEVIVIESSSDVISISEDDTADDDDDDDDDDEGVCASKSQGLQRLQTSTLAQKGTQKSESGLSVPVTVDSSSSESDSEESESKSEESDSSDSSDSDGLENWMILGAGKQDGDQCISLNLEGGSDSNAEVDEEGSWLVSVKDKEAQIYNKDKGARIAVQRLSNRYYTGKNVQCRNCNKNGHLSKNCPEPKKLSPCFLCGTPGHLVSECPNKHCNNCGMPGHLYRSCSEKAYWHKQCHRCNMKGHFFDACPEIWRQYHITTKSGVPVNQQGKDQGRTPAYCYNCARKGHYGHACTRPRMFNGTFPSTPFINHYDTVEDTIRRQHRIKSKVKELKKNGIFTAGSQTPLTPGPPKKKQKTSHLPNHTPHQGPHDHKPSPSHIFFEDTYDFTTSSPKTNTKYKQQESTGNVKPWKPKRPVPSSREPVAKLILDEADDFPRGGGKGEKRKRAKKTKPVPSVAPGGRWTVAGEMRGSETKQKKGGKRGNKRNQSRRIAGTKQEAQMYPTDENLFIIKQRKRNR